MPDHLRILLVDDEADLRRSLTDFLTGLGHRVATCATAEEALERDAGAEADLALIDIRMPGMDGLELLAEATTRWSHLPVILISGHGTLDLAIQALRLGATDFLRKPFALTDLEAAIARCVQRPVPAAGDGDETAMVGGSPALTQVREQIALAARSGLRTLLLEGETGTGKEVAARAFHRARAAGGPFVAVNCAALPEALVESELFGHAKGAFTGAGEPHAGAFVRAAGGVLLLDEVADLPPAAQAKLLRVLETWRVLPVGATREQALTCAVVSACNRPAATLVAEGRLRSDLYYRLNGFAISLPPLRERREDVPALARHLAARYAAEVGHAPWPLTDGALALLAAHDFPGNVRELRTLVQRACVFAGDGPVEARHIRIHAAPATAPAAAPLPAAPPGDEREATRLALVESGWNRAQAARRLGITYEAMRHRITKWGLNPR